jgi:hypothetical protein
MKNIGVVLSVVVSLIAAYQYFSFGGGSLKLTYASYGWYSTQMILAAASIFGVLATPNGINLAFAGIRCLAYAYVGYHAARWVHHTFNDGRAWMTLYAATIAALCDVTTIVRANK